MSLLIGLCWECFDGVTDTFIRFNSTFIIKYGPPWNTVTTVFIYCEADDIKAWFIVWNPVASLLVKVAKARLVGGQQSRPPMTT